MGEIESANVCDRRCVQPRKEHVIAMGKKDAFLTSIPTDVKDASSSKKVTLESKKKSRPTEKTASVDIERLKALHQERRDVCSKLDQKARRVEEKQAITEAISEYAKNKKNVRIGAGGSRRTYVDTIVYQYEQNPGPHYDPGKLRDRLDAPGMKIAQGNPKSEVEWCEYRARQLPGPAQYNVPKGQRIGSCSGGVFPKFTPPGLVESSVRSNAYKPGPGQYQVETDDGKGPAACISKSSAKSDVEWAMQRAAQLPGPGEYSTKNTGAIGNKVSSGHGRTAGATHINRAERRTITDIQVARRQGLPGPGEYGNFRTPSREAELRTLKRAALQQIKEHESTRSKSSMF